MSSDPPMSRRRLRPSRIGLVGGVFVALVVLAAGRSLLASSELPRSPASPEPSVSPVSPVSREDAALVLDASGLGPAPRSADGRFTNLVGAITHGTFGTRFPFAWRRMGTYFRSGRGAPERIENDGDFLRENARHSEPTVTWIGHATLLVQMEHSTFLTDPIWSARPSPISFLGPSRYVAPGVAIEDLPPIDFVVISHNHYDHLDLPTLRRLAARDPETVFYVPLGNGALLRRNGLARVEELDWGESAQHGETAVYCLPTQHWSKRGLGDDLEALWASWAVVGASRRFYFAGDTGYFAGFEQIGRALGPFDLAAVPIGAYAPRAMMQASHMNPEEAWQAARDVRARRALGMHYGTFDLSDEPLAEPPARFEAAAQSSRTPAPETDRVGRALEVAADPNPDSSPEVDTEAWLLRIGETRRF